MSGFDADFAGGGFLKRRGPPPKHKKIIKGAKAKKKRRRSDDSDGAAESEDDDAYVTHLSRAQLQLERGVAAEGGVGTHRTSGRKRTAVAR